MGSFTTEESSLLSAFLGPCELASRACVLSSSMGVYTSMKSSILVKPPPTRTV